MWQDHNFNCGAYFDLRSNNYSSGRTNHLGTSLQQNISGSCQPSTPTHFPSNALTQSAISYSPISEVSTLISTMGVNDVSTPCCNIQLGCASLFQPASPTMSWALFQDTLSFCKSSNRSNHTAGAGAFLMCRSWAQPVLCFCQ